MSDAIDVMAGARLLPDITVRVTNVLLRPTLLTVGRCRGDLPPGPT